MSGVIGYTEEFKREAAAQVSRQDHSLIIGGGYIASEFAGIFAGLGVKTVQTQHSLMDLMMTSDEWQELIKKCSTLT